MRSATPELLTELFQQYGSEPISIVEIDWSKGSSSVYCTKAINGTLPKLLSVGRINTMSSIEGMDSFQTNIVLDDCDGAVRAILDHHNVHLAVCRIYQLYAGVDPSKKLTLYTGHISTPLTYGEGDRQIEITVTCFVEGWEIGFSPEEGQLDFVSRDMVGVPWPLVFGSCAYVPATKVRSIARGRTLDKFTIVDPMLYRKLDACARAYQQEKMIFNFNMDIHEGLHNVAPPAWWIFDQFIRYTILARRQYAQLRKWNIKLEDLLKKAKADVENLQKRANLRVHRRAPFLAIVQQLNAVARTRLWLARMTEFIRWLYAQDMAVCQQAVIAYNNMCELFAQYRSIQAEICRQLSTQRTPIRVVDYQDFPDGEPLDICLQGVRFNVQFDHATRLMHFLHGPLNSFENLPVSDWQQDDEVCSGIDGMDGVNLFWLENDPPPNLEGMYLLVYKRGVDPATSNERHIIKVEKQDGRKVYFKLVEWAKPASSGRNKSLDEIVNQTLNPPGGWVTLGPFGASLPAGLFTGNLDPAIWMTPESAFFLSIINSIPGGVTRDEAYVLLRQIYNLPFDEMAFFTIVPVTVRDIYTIIGPDVGGVTAACPIIIQQWLDNYSGPAEELPTAMPFEAPVGSSIIRCWDTCEIYVANILPSTVRGVHAYRTTHDGSRVLEPVPSSWYIKDEAKDLGSYTVVTITMKTGLSTIPGQGWQDTLYVSLDSSVGPNVVDVLEWLILTYTDCTCDPVSFAYVHGLVEKYPVNFAILDRQNIFNELRRIAWEARLALTLRNDVFYLRYLAARPAQVDEVTEADIVTKTLRVSYSPTEAIITRVKATYDENYLPLLDGERKPRVIIRHNVGLYGLHPREEHFHIYNTEELVTKSATFWLIRWANTWKTITIEANQSKLLLDLYDGVLVHLASNFVTDTAEGVLCELGSSVYDVEANKLLLQLNVPIRAGEMVEYPFYWPALMALETWPTLFEIEHGYAGGAGPAGGVTGSVTNCPYAGETL